MGFTIETGISAAAVFAQGLLSFFSPCVLPLVPLYLGYLAGGANSPLDEKARRRVTLRNTLFFVLGISFAFFVLGLGFTTLGRFFTGNRALVTRIGGILVILLGLGQLGIFEKSKASQREYRLPFDFSKWQMNPVTALVLGFVFSFAWTPCVGPALAGVLLMAGSAATRAQGFVLIGVYTLGFVLPFLAMGLFADGVQRFFKSRRHWLKYTAKIGGALLILMGVMMFTGWMNGFSGYLSGLGGDAGTPAASSRPQTSQSQGTSEPGAAPSSGSSEALPSAPDFTLIDQYGETHTLSDYKGKVVFLNFWATWCGPCKNEMPDIQQLYLDEGENQNDVVVLGVANPKHPDHSGSVDDKTAAEVGDWMAQQGYTYPVAMDETGDVFATYGIAAYPTTFMIDAEGNVFGYVQGGITRDIMNNIVEQTQSGTRQN